VGDNADVYQLYVHLLANTFTLEQLLGLVRKSLPFWFILQHCQLLLI